MLTNASVSAAKPLAQPYKLHDSGGLHLLVRPTGSKTFRMKYRRGGKEQLLTIGTWPQVSLSDARARRDSARDQLDRGVDIKINADVAGETFEQLAQRWHLEQAEHWSAEHADDVLASLKRDVFPAIGARAPEGIRPREIRDILLAVERRGCKETARRLRERISGIFRLGIHDELCDSDPAAIVADRLGPRPVQVPQPALTDLTEVVKLLHRVDALEAPMVHKYASTLCALTAVRLGSLRGARWDELENIPGLSATIPGKNASDECNYASQGCNMPVWRIPPARMKLRKTRKADPTAEHVIPLSEQAIALLVKLHELTGDGELLFPGRIAGRTIGEGAIGELYDRAGFGGRHVPHGWRASFSTILNERYPRDQFPGHRSLIDQALGHTPKDKVEAAYNRSQQLRATRALFQEWAELIAPRSGSTVR